MRGPDPLAPSDHARHSQDWWLSVALTGDIPSWLRVAAFAFGQHGNNRHTPLSRQQLAKELGERGRPVPRQRLKEWIDEAIDRGFLERGSTSMCLVVPLGQVDKGTTGAPKTTCPVHARRARAKTKASENHAGSADALLKESRLRQDALEQESGDHAGTPDALRSAPFSSPTSPQPTVSRRATTTGDLEASA